MTDPSDPNELKERKVRDATKRRKRRLRYKAGVSEEGVQAKPGIQYHGGNFDLSPGGLRVPWRESTDNPMSQTFIPLTERTERAKSRWWALYNKRNVRPKHGVFDP